MNYLSITGTSFFIYILFYFLIMFFINEEIKTINIIEQVKNALKKNNLDGVSVDVNVKNKSSYGVVEKVIYINNQQTLNALASSFHELGHAIRLKDKKFANLSLFKQLLWVFLEYSSIIGIMGVVFSEIYNFNLYINLFIKLSLIIGTIYLFITIKEEYLASKIGYKNINIEIPFLTDDQKLKIKSILANCFLSHLFLFLVSLATTIYYFS